jgi:hypothetical protein
MLSQWIEIFTYSDPSCVFRPLLLDSLAKPPELIDLHCGYLCLYLRVRPFTVDQCVLIQELRVKGGYLRPIDYTHNITAG